MASLPVTLRKRRLVVKASIDKRGQIVYDERSLPPSAHTITGAGAFAQPRAFLTPAAPFCFVGAMQAVPHKVDGLTKGALTLPDGNQPARAQFTQSAGEGQYLFYAYPTQLPQPVFSYRGLTGGFVEVGSLYALVDTQVRPYRLWRSVTPNLGADVLVTITHP